MEVPGQGRPHDLAAEINVVNAPRLLKKNKGDFSFQVKVEGAIEPGATSTLPGRTGYKGAGIVLMNDDQNVICLARAALQRVGTPPRPYVNFEMRADGSRDGSGDARIYPLPLDGAVFIRIKREGAKVHGSTSLDGQTWTETGSKEIPAAWPAELNVGVVAISTSTTDFAPKFSGFSLQVNESGQVTSKPFQITGLDHLQLAMPAGGEDRARAFYSTIPGLIEVPKPPNPAKRGGTWFEAGTMRLHLGVEVDFRPARKAHPAFLVRHLAGLIRQFERAGVSMITDEPLEGYDRIYIHDPFGNRIEPMEPLSSSRSGTID